MASGGWLPIQDPVQLTAAQGLQGARGGPYELRPLSLGEVLDRTFAVYRAHFWLFVGISALSAVVQLVANAIQLSMYRGIAANPRTFQAGFKFGTQQAGGGVTGLLFFLASAVTQAATVWALSEVYLGRRATIGTSVRAVIGRWLRFVGIGLWQGWSLLWVPLLLIVPGILLMGAFPWRIPWLGGTLIFLGATGGMVAGVIFFLRNSLAVQAAVVEKLKVRMAMRRSKVLTAGAKGRVFVVLLITYCLFMVAGMLQMPLLFVVVRGVMRGEQHVLAQAAMLVVNFGAHSMVMPVALIGLSLVYFDQRVRQEALDLLLMLGGGTETGLGEAAEAERPLNAGELGPANDASAL